MVDYRLDGLGTRTFEHLVQALSLREISTIITPFGDGPDGAREATFDGETGYGTPGNTWNGYGVIQAKFLQRSKGPVHDGRWIVTEARKELARFTRKQIHRKPNYYILATNITLTAVEQSGSKDRLFRLLEDFSRRIGLAAFDVWDYDKIRIFLDANEEIRKSYAAWITSGDVLADLSKWLGSERPSYYSLIINYLQKELVSDQYARLEQAGHSADEAIPLSQVFIDLPVVRRRTSDGAFHDNTARDFVSLIVENATTRLRPEDLDQEMHTATPPIGRYVLIGGPGQGKTTIGQYACQIFRAALLSSVSRKSLVDPEAHGVIRGISTAANGLMEQVAAKRVPFRVVLSDFATDLASGKSSSLLDHITQGFNKRTNAKLGIKQFERLLEEYPSILVLDGLDEVPSSTNRDQVISAIKDFWVDVASNSIDILAIATSRPQGYGDEFSPNLYEHYSLCPLSTEKAIQYGRCLAELRFKGDARRIGTIVSRLSRAAEVPATAKLMQSPLQVTILTLLVDRMGQPPQERWVLFNEYYKLIYQRETERDIPAAHVLREHRSDIDAVHERVGLLLQVESERTGGTDAKLTTDQFSTVVHQYLVEEGHEAPELDRLKASIIQGAAERLVFLVGLELGQVGFEIRSLQEFMAAQGLMNARDEIVQLRLKLIARSVNWRNVFLFAAGRVFMERKYLRDSVVSACTELNDDPHDQVAQIVAAGSEIAMELLEDGPAAKHPTTSGVLTRLAFRLLTSPGKWSRRLADLYQDRNRSIYLEELQRGVSATDSHFAAAALACAFLLTKRNIEGFSAILYDASAIGALSDEMILEAAQVDLDILAWLNRNLGVSLLSYPINRIFELLETDEVRATVVDELLKETGNEWIRWFVDDQLARHSQSIQLKDRANRTFTTVTISSLLRLSESILVESATASTHRRLDWQFIYSCYQFICTPSLSALANSLDLAADTIDAKQFPHFVTYGLPWPLGETLASAEDATALRNLAADVRRGALGDVSDWRAWEDQWISQGIRAEEVSDAVAVSSGSGPKMWFPIRSLISIRSRDVNSTQFARKLLEFRETPAGEIAALGLLGPHFRDQLSRRSPWGDAVFRENVLWLTRRMPTLGVDIICAAPPPFSPTEEWAEAIGRIDIIGDFSRRRRNESGVEFLLEAWLKWPRYEGILLVLEPRVYHTDLLQKMRAATGSLFPHDDAKENINLAKVLILLRSGTPLEEILPCVSRRWATEWTWSRLSASIVDQPAIKADERLLMIRRAAISASVPTRRLDENIRQIFRRRVSGLGDRSQWNSLELPQALFDLLS